MSNSENSWEQSFTENLHVRELSPLMSPNIVKSVHPASNRSIGTVALGRQTNHSILENPNSKSRLIVVVGPCSINDPEAAMEYATWLQQQREEYINELEIIMRVYFEKPRTTIGWKGLINDPNLDESYDINNGLLIARKLVCDITDMGLPIGSELLDTQTPQYFAGLMSWGAIGARTTESQLHRELASGLSFPVGFKNGTTGNTQVAVDAVSAASKPHHFPAMTNDGMIALAKTSGNPDCHVILRGGTNGPNYNEDSIASIIDQLERAGLTAEVMIDASHKNSGGDYRKQIEVVRNVSGQVSRGSVAVIGMMIESNLKEGSQPFTPGEKHKYGVSITDGCVNLNQTTEMFGLMSEAVKSRAA